jgi:hypothetical protein
LGGLLGLSLLVPMAVALAQLAQGDMELSDSPYLRIDPDKIVLDERDTRIPCGECHNLEYEVWQDTEHATGFDQLHRSDQAQAILDKMGFRRSKSESLCLKCHYTAKVDDGDVEAIAGVSCESCHGAARDWVNLHQDYGGATRETETAEHKQMRIEQSIANGMLRPSSNLYAVAANCFECHTVPEEELINVGGHPSGSSFELTDWSGEIRHNFLHAQWSESSENRDPSPERQRMMYVIGRALDYEYSIRGAARASAEGAYAKAMESRVKSARRELDKILRLVDIPEIAGVVRAGQDARLVPNTEDALIATSERISAQTQAFAREYDGTELAALDPLIRGEEVDLGGGDAEEAIADTGNPYEARTRPAWFPTLAHDVIGPGGCSCHGPADPVSGIDKLAWHENDAHSGTAEPLLTESARAVQIAQAYGLSAEQMRLGNQLCMNCHGTIVTGNEAFEVDEGVSCQSCHGPAEAYVGQHQAGGYEQGEPLGMVQLEEPSVRAANCARCHHITDERLLASGHSTGDAFQMSNRNGRIRHWAEPSLDGGELNVAYTSTISARPIPEVELVAAASAPAESVPDATRPTPEPPAPDPDDSETETESAPPTLTPDPVAEPVAAARVVGEARQTPSWFPTFRQTTLAPLQNCGCHGQQLQWHRDDAHNFSAEPLLTESARAVRIAQNYGLSTTEMKQGNQMCMSCHGSVETGAEASQVFDGVSCQSCHGPAGEYVNAHQSGGYDQGASAGMVRLEQLDARANNCARCHHITDERLISAGHSTGEGFELASRNGAIEHWEGPNHGAGALNSAWASAISSRPVPGVQQASLPPPAASAAPRRARSSSSSGSSGQSAALPTPPTPRPVSGFTPPSGGGAASAANAPVASDTTSTEDLLLIVKQRLENLYKRLGNGE